MRAFVLMDSVTEFQHFILLAAIFGIRSSDELVVLEFLRKEAITQHHTSFKASDFEFLKLISNRSHQPLSPRRSPTDLLFKDFIFL